MTDTLRDRIARVIYGRTPGGAISMHAAQQAADAIIDDLGLIVDRVIRALPPEHLQDAPMDSPEVQEWASQQPTSSRVVGRWEA